MGVRWFAHPYFLFAQGTGTLSQIASMMTLAVLLDGKACLAHRFHHQNIPYHRHDRSRSGRRHPQQTHLVGVPCSQTDIGRLSQRTVRISRDDDFLQRRIQPRRQIREFHNFAGLS